MAPRRPFSLLDTMILVAATAAGLGVIRGLFGDSALRPVNHRVSTARVLAQILGRVVLATPCAGAWTVALLAIRLRRPRPPLRRLARQPGMVATAAASVGLAIFGIDSIVLAALSAALVVHDWSWRVFLEQLSISADLIADGFPMPGVAVAAAWLTLALGGRWRTEPSWIDRAGRLAGVGWLASILLPWLRFGVENLPP